MGTAGVRAHEGQWQYPEWRCPQTACSPGDSSTNNSLTAAVCYFHLLPLHFNHKMKKKPQQLTLSSHHLTESRGFWHCCSLNGLLSLSHWTSKLTMPGQVWDPHWECEGLLLFKTAMLQSPFLMQCVCSQKPKFYFPFLKLWCSVVMSACEWI